MEFLDLQGKEVIQNIWSRARRLNQMCILKKKKKYPPKNFSITRVKSCIHSFYLCDLNVDDVSFKMYLLLDMREVKTAWDLGKC